MFNIIVLSIFSQGVSKLCRFILKVSYYTFLSRLIRLPLLIQQDCSQILQFQDTALLFQIEFLLEGLILRYLLTDLLILFNSFLIFL